MTEDTSASAEDRPIPIEPDARLVVLARALQVQGEAQASRLETARQVADHRTSLGQGCLGRALYRHRSVFQGASDAPVWSHLELSYFRGILPAEAIHDLVVGWAPEQARLLRAEILLTTPASFTMPRGWRGSAARPERQVSLEYIHVRPDRLDAYREIMRRYIGPAAARLVAAGRIGTFRAMETAVVLHRDPAFDVDWNQIHLCEVEAEGFDGFGRAFDAALREIAPGAAPKGGFTGVFAGLDSMRTIPRWTFNDAVVEADLALGRPGMRPPG